MQNRRDFIKKSGLLTLGTLSSNPLFEAFGTVKNKPIGIQLYTFFNTIDQDVRGTLQKIQSIGYQEVESAFSKQSGFYGMKAKEFATLLQEIGLSWQSHHVLGNPVGKSKMPSLQTDAQLLADTAAEGGVKYLVCSMIDVTTSDKIKGAVDILSNAGEIAKKAGLTLCYHNHEAEFKKIGDKTPYEIFLTEINGDILKFELDLAWVSKAGVDPVELFQKYKGRFPLVHVKDFDINFINLMPVGEGIIDFKRILDKAKTGGIKHFFVEHDMPKDPMASINSSFGYLKKIL